MTTDYEGLIVQVIYWRDAEWCIKGSELHEDLSDVIAAIRALSDDPNGGK